LIDVPAASQLIAKNQALRILDVRTAEEYKEGHLEGAVLVPVQEKAFVEEVKKSIKPDEPVLVYCRSGGRSAKAVAMLREAGYTKLQELKGGMIAWEEAKQPTKK
jgi:rhodanese-related sulfurtransferase